MSKLISVPYDKCEQILGYACVVDGKPICIDTSIEYVKDAVDVKHGDLVDVIIIIPTENML